MSRLFGVVCLLLVASSLADIKRPTRAEWEAQDAIKQQKKQTAAAKEKKMGAVSKLVEMLENLKKNTLAEGEREAESYNTFACFCKDKNAEVAEAIQRGVDAQNEESALLHELAEKRDELDRYMQARQEAIDLAEHEKKVATAARKRLQKIYDHNVADVASGVASLEAAINVMKTQKDKATGRDESFLQVKSDMETLKNAAAIVESMTGQAPDVDMENYKFKSDGVIAMMRPILETFRDNKHKLDLDEAKSISDYDALMQEKNDWQALKQEEYNHANGKKQKCIEHIAEENERLTEEAAELMANRKYMAELMVMCSDKAETWEQRQLTRSQELGALTTVIEIVKTDVSDHTSGATMRLAQKTSSVRVAQGIANNEQAMEAIEAEVEDAPEFIQAKSERKQIHSIAKSEPNQLSAIQAVADLLRSKGEQMSSPMLLGIASKVSDSPFTKVTQLIQELIQRLLKEANNESNQKGWCDKATKDAEQKRNYAVEDVGEYNADLAKVQAFIDKLVEELAENKKLWKDTVAAGEESKKNREEEHQENAETVTEAEAGLKAIKLAKDVMSKFYAVAKKQTVLMKVNGPAANDAPDAGFDNMESYNGNQGAAQGIVGMMEVIQTDFERTIKETEKAEQKSAMDAFNFEGDVKSQVAQCEEIEKEKERQLQYSREKEGQDKDNLAAANAKLKAALEELMELKPTCIDTGMSYEERVQKREEEIESLNKALCIFNAFQSGDGREGAEDC